MAGVDQFATGKSLTKLLVAYCLYAPMFFYSAAPYSVAAIEPYAARGGILDVEMFYTAQQAYDRIASFGESGRAVYLHILMGDMIYPAILGFLIATSISLVLRWLGLSGTYWRYLSLLPLVNMAFDYIENVALIFILIAYPTQMPGIASIAGMLTFLKNVFGLLSFSVLLLVFAKWSMNSRA